MHKLRFFDGDKSLRTQLYKSVPQLTQLAKTCDEVQAWWRDPPPQHYAVGANDKQVSYVPMHWLQGK